MRYHIGMDQQESNIQEPVAGRIIAGVFGFVFGGIGLTVLGFMWLSPTDGFDSPPLFFRVFASFIAIPFVAIGGTLFYGAITGKALQGRAARQLGRMQTGATTNSGAPSSPAGGYRCPSCGAPLGKDADVSPSGDVKCRFCNTWFNIHRSGT